jgi:flagellar protein FlgJ
MEGLSLDPRALYREVKAVTPPAFPSSSASFSDALKGARKAAANAATSVRQEELKKACTAMEALFVEQVVNAMRKNVGKSELDGGFGREVFEDMLYTEYSQKMADSGQFGLGKMMYEQMKDYI